MKTLGLFLVLASYGGSGKAEEEKKPLYTKKQSYALRITQAAIGTSVGLLAASQLIQDWKLYQRVSNEFKAASETYTLLQWNNNPEWQFLQRMCGGTVVEYKNDKIKKAADRLAVCSRKARVTFRALVPRASFWIATAGIGCYAIKKSIANSKT